MGPGVGSETLEPLAYISQPCSAAILQHFSTYWEPKIPTLPQTNYEQGTPSLLYLPTSSLAQPWKIFS